MPLVKHHRARLWLTLCLLLSGCVETEALLRKLDTRPGGGLSQEQIAAGLREALRVGTERAVHSLARPDGYYGDLRLRIPLPEGIAGLEDPLRRLGFGSQVDGFVTSMNRAAERAAPQALDIFVQAASRMSVDDARRILQGPDDAATRYFEAHTGNALRQAFRPIVNQALGEVGATRVYQRLLLETRALPFSLGVGPNLEDYVTDRALHGLFLLLAEEEQRIRREPVARTTALLRQVFGTR